LGEILLQAEKKMGFFSGLAQRLKRTRSALTEGLATLVLGKKEIDDELLEEIETRLLMADVGVATTQQVISDLTAQVNRKQLNNPDALIASLKTELEQILLPCEKHLQITQPENPPYVILVIGVNGNGKTTTIGKLAKQLQQAGKKVMLAAGDTYRAAAIEQLQIWGERNEIPVIAQHSGADSASVVFDAMQAAKARNIDVLIADTAGRLHTQKNLMEELKKIKRVISKVDVNAPHEILLVLDATTGQNALRQAQEFNEAVGVTGIALTKLDGTAKGGIIFALAKTMKLPIRFIGVGEQIDDLKPFNAKEFVEACFVSGSYA
jgi:fused signal recognition particle receptor